MIKPLYLIFRVSIHDLHRNLSTWYGSSCSTWTGLACHNPTGKVLSLTLSGLNLSGELHPSLCKLTSLRTLNLSLNRFVGSILGTFVSLKELRELVLSDNRDIGGVIPHWFGDFSMNLERVDLSLCSFRAFCI